MNFRIYFFNEAPIWVSSLLGDDLLGLTRPRHMLDFASVFEYPFS